jgi:hypothetical protein
MLKSEQEKLFEVIILSEQVVSSISALNAHPVIVAFRMVLIEWVQILL